MTSTCKISITLPEIWHGSSLGYRCVAKKVRFQNIPTGRYTFLGLVFFGGKLHDEKSFNVPTSSKRTYLLFCNTPQVEQTR